MSTAEQCLACGSIGGLGDPVARRPWREDMLCYECTAKAIEREDQLIARLLTLRAQYAARFSRQHDDPTPEEIAERAEAIKQAGLKKLRESQPITHETKGIQPYRRFGQRSYAGGAA